MHDDDSMLQHFLRVYGINSLVEMKCRLHWEYGRTILHTAAWYGALRCLRILLSIGLSIDVIDSPSSRRTPLMEAVIAGHHMAAVMLVEAGASLSSQDVRGDTGEIYAAVIPPGLKYSQLHTWQSSIQDMCC